MPDESRPSPATRPACTSSPTTNVSSRWPNCDIEEASRRASFSGVSPSRRAATPGVDHVYLGCAGGSCPYGRSPCRQAHDQEHCLEQLDVIGCGGALQSGLPSCSRDVQDSRGLRRQAAKQRRQLLALAQPGQLSHVPLQHELDVVIEPAVAGRRAAPRQRDRHAAGSDARDVLIPGRRRDSSAGSGARRIVEQRREQVLPDAPDLTLGERPHRQQMQAARERLRWRSGSAS